SAGFFHAGAWHTHQCVWAALRYDCRGGILEKPRREAALEPAGDRCFVAGAGTQCGHRVCPLRVSAWLGGAALVASSAWSSVRAATRKMNFPFCLIGAFLDYCFATPRKR